MKLVFELTGAVYDSAQARGEDGQHGAYGGEEEHRGDGELDVLDGAVDGHGGCLREMGGGGYACPPHGWGLCGAWRGKGDRHEKARRGAGFFVCGMGCLGGDHCPPAAHGGADEAEAGDEHGPAGGFGDGPAGAGVIGEDGLAGAIEVELEIIAVAVSRAENDAD